MLFVDESVRQAYYSKRPWREELGAPLTRGLEELIAKYGVR
jgi:hypothetical protein